VACDARDRGCGRLLKPARYYWLLLAESHLTRRLFGAMVGRIAALPVAPGAHHRYDEIIEQLRFDALAFWETVFAQNPQSYLAVND
jgi:hypothetical protein